MTTTTRIRCTETVFNLKVDALSNLPRDPEEAVVELKAYPERYVDMSQRRPPGFTTREACERVAVDPRFEADMNAWRARWKFPRSLGTRGAKHWAQIGARPRSDIPFVTAAGVGSASITADDIIVKTTGHVGTVELFDSGIEFTEVQTRGEDGSRRPDDDEGLKVLVPRPLSDEEARIVAALERHGVRRDARGAFVPVMELEAIQRDHVLPHELDLWLVEYATTGAPRPEEYARTFETEESYPHIAASAVAFDETGWPVLLVAIRLPETGDSHKILHQEVVPLLKAFRSTPGGRKRVHLREQVIEVARLTDSRFQSSQRAKVWDEEFMKRYVALYPARVPPGQAADVRKHLIEAVILNAVRQGELRLEHRRVLARRPLPPLRRR